MGELYNDPNRECLGLAPVGADPEAADEVIETPLKDDEDE